MKDDTISRAEAIDALNVSMIFGRCNEKTVTFEALKKYAEGVREGIEALPSAQPERDIPKKPISTTDRAWGIPLRQAVCPNCNVYLGMIHFISESKTKVTYCETCGQAIDWEGWDCDE